MKQPRLVAALLTALWLLVDPLLQWFIRWPLDHLRTIAAWCVLAVLVLIVPHAVERGHAAWSATFAALAVALNPLWPLAAPGQARMIASIAAGVALAVYAIRRWK